MSGNGKVVLVPTPIGNLGDMTVRALETLRSADVIACEDTRRTGRLLAHYEIPHGKLARFHEHNERASAQRLLDEAETGKLVVLVTDAGMPAISDPGYRLVEGAVERDVPLEVLPGPSAVLVALAASGLPVASFTFRGFPPRKPGKLRNFLATTLESAATQILYESPHRVGKLLSAAHEVYGDRPAAVCRELTKLHEEVRRGRLGELAEYYGSKTTKGEIAVVIAGNENAPTTIFQREE